MTPKPGRLWAFRVLLAVLIALPLSFFWVFVWPRLQSGLRASLLDHMVRSMSEKERRDLRDQAGRIFGGNFDVVPDPRVGRIGRRGISKTLSGVEYRANNLGFRDRRHYGPADGRHTRVVLLGDSNVYGLGLAMEHRYGEQLQAWLEAHAGEVGGKPFEVLSLGLPSWNTIQETQYMRTLLTPLAPDLIVLLFCFNDMEVSAGVTGFGALTEEFSPEFRALGTGTFRVYAGRYLGSPHAGALGWDLSPAARARWQAMFSAVASLGRAQQARGGKLLVEYLTTGAASERYFEEILRSHIPALEAAGVPTFRTSYFPLRGGTIVGNGDLHANREGNALLVAHLLHILRNLGWLSLEAASLPDLDPELSPVATTAPDPASLEAHRGELVEQVLQSRLVFAELPEEGTRLDAWRAADALLGGILRGRERSERDLWAANRAGFLLRREGTAGERLRLLFRAPSRVEIYPLRLSLQLDGGATEVLDLPGCPASPEGEEREWVVELPASLPEFLGTARARVLEVVLEASNHFCEVEDPRMRSIQLISAEVLPRPPASKP